MKNENEEPQLSGMGMNNGNDKMGMSYHRGLKRKLSASGALLPLALSPTRAPGEGWIEMQRNRRAERGRKFLSESPL
jgi:hypothetical protein